MTLPNERTRAVRMAREFLRDLLNPKLTPRVPKAIRERAYWCLRHYPAPFDFKKAAKADPRTWGPPESENEEI